MLKNNSAQLAALFSFGFPALMYSIPPMRLVKHIIANKRRERLNASSFATPMLPKSMTKPASLMPEPPKTDIGMPDAILIIKENQHVFTLFSVHSFMQM